MINENKLFKALKDARNLENFAEFLSIYEGDNLSKEQLLKKNSNLILNDFKELIEEYSEETLIALYPGDLTPSIIFIDEGTPNGDYSVVTNSEHKDLYMENIALALKNLEDLKYLKKRAIVMQEDFLAEFCKQLLGTITMSSDKTPIHTLFGLPVHITKEDNLDLAKILITQNNINEIYCIDKKGMFMIDDKFLKVEKETL